MKELFENRETRAWRESQEAKCDTDDNFIDTDTDSQYDLEIWQGGARLRRMRASVQFSAGAGWHILDRLGRKWALDERLEGDGLAFILDLRERHVRDIMKGIGWQREVPKR